MSYGKIQRSLVISFTNMDRNKQKLGSTPRTPISNMGPLLCFYWLCFYEYCCTVALEMMDGMTEQIQVLRSRSTVHVG